MPPNSDVLEAPLRHVYKPLPHDSGAKHVQGSAEYIDDIPEPIGTLHIAVGGTPVARGWLRRLDLSEVRNAPGVVAVVTAADIPGKNDISPGSADETAPAWSSCALTIAWLMAAMMRSCSIDGSLASIQAGSILMALTS